MFMCAYCVVEFRHHASEGNRETWGKSTTAMVASEESRFTDPRPRIDHRPLSVQPPTLRGGNNVGDLPYHRHEWSHVNVY